MSMELSFKEKMIQGRIGKRYVIKHYKTYKVKTKVPDMSGIIPSRGQKRQRRLFRLAVQYAQEIYWNPAKREEKERIYRRPWRLFQKLMKEWFQKRKAKREAAQRRLTIWRRNVEVNGGMDWKLVVDQAACPPVVGDCFATARNDDQQVDAVFSCDR
ncbi:MAG TPA: hypothetical protein VHK91_04930 [Flavisolibacter sp.]|jgi:hypothetical protein|nr:hypothetical protein [Flavisolibacter sp.]